MVEAEGPMDIAEGLGGELKPPMANGEVLFEEPWHGRVFGMAVALHEAGVFTWQEFQHSLIEAVGAWDKAASATDSYQYYERFEAALSSLLAAKQLVGDGDLSDRTAAFAARPHGHDH